MATRAASVISFGAIRRLARTVSAFLAGAAFALCLPGESGEAAAAVSRAKPHASQKASASKHGKAAKSHVKSKHTKSRHGKKARTTHAKAGKFSKVRSLTTAKPQPHYDSAPAALAEAPPRAARKACLLNNKIYLLADCNTADLPAAPLAASAIGQETETR